MITKKHFDEMVKQMKEEGMSEENIIAFLFKLFNRGDCDINELEIMTGWMGCELDPYFKAEALKHSKNK